ncbi:MAG: hypothetical protein Q9222_001772 [Ikaeria aurantiellina]
MIHNSPSLPDHASIPHVKTKETRSNSNRSDAHPNAPAQMFKLDQEALDEFDQKLEEVQAFFKDSGKLPSFVGLWGQNSRKATRPVILATNAGQLPEVIHTEDRRYTTARAWSETHCFWTLDSKGKRWIVKPYSHLNRNDLSLTTCIPWIGLKLTRDGIKGEEFGSSYIAFKIRGKAKPTRPPKKRSAASSGNNMDDKRDTPMAKTEVLPLSNAPAQAASAVSERTAGEHGDVPGSKYDNVPRNGEAIALQSKESARAMHQKNGSSVTGNTPSKIRLNDCLLIHVEQFQTP